MWEVFVHTIFISSPDAILYYYFVYSVLKVEVMLIKTLYVTVTNFVSIVCMCNDI